MKFLNKSELKYIFYSSVFAFVFFVVVIPNIIDKISGISPYIQFLIFNVGLLFFLTIYLKYTALDKKVPFAKSLSVFFLIVGLDIMIPPLMLSLTGQLSSQALLSASSSDYVIGMFWQSLGINGFMGYIFTYVITPIIFFIISAIINKNFVEEI